MMRSLLVSLFFICMNCISFAENQCVDGSEKNLLFRKAIQTSNASLIRNFRASSGFKLSEGRLGCATGNCEPAVSALSLKSEVSEIPVACIKSSLKREISQGSYECRRQSSGNWQFVKHGASSSSTPCIDDTTIDYVHHVTNKVVSCFQGLELGNGVIESVDPKVIFSVINNESGFNFTYNYGGGVGAGGLTGPAVEEMNVLNPSKTNGKVQPGRGRFILDAILNSKQTGCQALKPIIKNDLKFKYNSPRTVNCEWNSLETGLARNLIYSIGYFSFLKNQVIGRELKKRSPTAFKDQDLLNSLTMIAYGPSGQRHALPLIRTLGLNSQRSIEAAKKRLRNESYVRRVNLKAAEVKRIAGDSCRFL